MKTHHSKKTAVHTFQTSFDETAADRAALAPTALVTIKLDVSVALTTVLGTLAHLAALRDAIAQLPGREIDAFDKLEVYAEALAHANTAFLAASQPPSELRELMPRAIEIRALLLSDVTALVNRGLVDGKPFADLKGPVGYLNIASDIGVIVRVLRERWVDISTKSAAQADELDEAEQIFERITVAYAERARQPGIISAASEERQRACTLLVNAYDKTRRAVQYIRWDEGDADKLAPSLYARRTRRGSRASPTPPAPPVADPSELAHADGAAPVCPHTNGAAVAVAPGGSPFAHDG
jgi:hypothetical protein